MTLITTAAMQSGFSGGLVVDYPNSTRAKKYTLRSHCPALSLTSGYSGTTCVFSPEFQKPACQGVCKARTTRWRLGTKLDMTSAELFCLLLPISMSTVAKLSAPTSLLCCYARQAGPHRRQKGQKNVGVKIRDWIQGKKERRRKQGKNVARDSKYSGRQRRPKF